MTKLSQVTFCHFILLYVLHIPSTWCDHTYLVESGMIAHPHQHFHFCNTHLMDMLNLGGSSAQHSLPLTVLKQKSFNSHSLHLWSYSHSMNLPFTCSTEDHNLVRIFLPGNWWLSWRIKGSSCHCWNRWLSICLYLADLLWLFLFFCSKLASQIYWHVWPWELTLFLQQDFSVLWECTRQDAKWV